jgi:hypothetical protein
VTRELVAATLCIISVDPHARVLMVGMGVVDVLGTLSATTSGLIHVICARLAVAPAVLQFALSQCGAIAQLFQILPFFVRLCVYIHRMLHTTIRHRL